MKNKKTTWILLPAVFAIWGILGWKVYAAMKSDEPGVATPANVNDVVEQEISVPDTYQLLLDYNDPFLKEEKPGRNFRKTVVSVPSKTATTEPMKPPQKSVEVSWPEISYSGLVKSPKDGKMVGFLSVDGTSHFVKPGEVVGDITVREIWRDSVRLTRGKEIRFVRK